MKRTLRGVGCFVEYNGKFLILHRNPDKPEGNTWDLPGGKIEPGETDVQAVARETFEETSIKAPLEQFELLGVFDFEFPNLSLAFPTYRLRLAKQPIAVHDQASHQALAWVTAQECYAMPNLIPGFQELLKKTGYI